MRLRERLLVAPDGPRQVVHRGAQAVYVDLDGRCIGLLSATATRVPCALWSSCPDLAGAGVTGGAAAVSGGDLVLDGVRLRIERLVDPRIPAMSSSGRVTTRSPGQPDRHTSSVGPRPLDLPSLDLPPDGRLTPAHVHDLLGRGPGLTPLGDDVLAGWLATRAAARAPDPAVTAAVRRGLATTTMLSATLLDCALHGEALPQLRAWLGRPGQATEAALLAVGATSGAGLLAGARLALASLPLAEPDSRPDRPKANPARANRRAA